MRTWLAASAAVLALASTGCSLGGDDGLKFKPVAAPQVSLSAKLKGPVKVGLLVSSAAQAGEGADWFGPAGGARVAEYRFTQGGADVTLVVRDDKGSADGAVGGVRAMLAQHVAGIVAATTGSHLDAALREAAGAGVPVLLPYEHRDVGGATTAWYTGPGAGDVRGRLRALLTAQGLTRPYVLAADGSGAEVTGLAPAGDASTVGPRQRAADAVAPVVAAARRLDSVVVAGSARTQAALVAELQGRAPDLAVVLTPEALSPAFGDALADRLAADGSATPAGRFLTVGRASVDATATGAGVDADAMSAFLAAARLAARAPSVHALTKDVPFGDDGAGAADVAAHDAVVALVRAAERAGSSDATAVGQTLGASSLQHAEGLAGPPLDFAAHRALDDGALVGLASTTQDPGLRGSRVATLTWFVLPAGG